jgi:hypothetical protein
VAALKVGPGTGLPLRADGPRNRQAGEGPLLGGASGPPEACETSKSEANEQIDQNLDSFSFHGVVCVDRRGKDPSNLCLLRSERPFLVTPCRKYFEDPQRLSTVGFRDIG